MTAVPQPVPVAEKKAAAARTQTAPWALLFGRTGLFFVVQAMFALGFYLAGSTSAWNDGIAWWPIGVTIANVICLTVLIYLFRAEGKKYWDIFQIRRGTIKSDLLALAAAFLVIGPLGYFPNVLLGGWLFGDSEAVLELFVRPLPMWAVYASIILFPITQGLVELAFYFAYVMPRLNGHRFPNLLPVLLPALMLGLQHIAAPFVFDVRFIAWRGLMFIPFAFAIGIILHWRPRLLPYAAIIHVLMDLSFATMFLSVGY